MKNDLKNLMSWLALQLEGKKFADLTVRIRIHDGRISLIERSITEKMKPDQVSTRGLYENTKN